LILEKGGESLRVRRGKKKKKRGKKKRGLRKKLYCF